MAAVAERVCSASNLDHISIDELILKEKGLLTKKVKLSSTKYIYQSLQIKSVVLSTKERLINIKKMLKLVE